MRLNKILMAGFLMTAFLVSCKDDDDQGAEPIEERDRSEQELEDKAALEEYLQTHFYNYEEFKNPSEDFDYVVRFDTINEANADKTPLIESELLERKTVIRNEVDYTIYVLKVREGEGEKATFADSTLVSYRGELLNRTTFDNSVTPVWFDLPGYVVVGAQNRLEKRGGVVTGFAQGLSGFRGASNYEVNADNTIEWENDFGIGAVLMPSGLGYFSQAAGRIPAYSPIIFSFQLFGVNQTDHDRDGIPSYMEDINEDENLFNDDTDGNQIPNHSDNDDDGDFIPTREEIKVNQETGEISFPDKDGDGTPDHLDPDN